MNHDHQQCVSWTCNRNRQVSHHIVPIPRACPEWGSNHCLQVSLAKKHMTLPTMVSGHGGKERLARFYPVLPRFALRSAGVLMAAPYYSRLCFLRTASVLQRAYSDFKCYTITRPIVCTQLFSVKYWANTIGLWPSKGKNKRRDCGNNKKILMTIKQDQYMSVLI